MEKLNFILVCAVIAVVFAGIANAAYSIDKKTSEIEKDYFGGEIVRGKLNMSFTDEPNDRFSSNFLGGARILEILRGMNYTKENQYTCEPISCQDTYETYDGGTTKKISLANSAQSRVGFVLFGNVEEILDKDDGFKMTIKGDAGENCAGQIYIDLLDDGIIDFYNGNASDKVCDKVSKNFGCFRNDRTLEEAKINNKNPYCEKISFPAAPGYRIGAVVRVGGKSGGIRFSLYNMNGTFLGGQRLENASSGDANVDIKYSSEKEFEGFVCVKVDLTDGADYYIKKRVANDSCGMYELPPVSGKPNYVADYEIYAQPMKYAPVNEIEFDRNYYGRLHSGGNLIKKINDYVRETYRFDCEDGCVIPVTLWGVNQNIEISNAMISYDTASGEVATREIYSLNEKDFTITTKKFVELDVGKMNFKVPNEDGEQDFKVYLGEGNALIFEREIDVTEGFEFTLGPRFALVGQPTMFSAFSSEEIIYSSWDFGDGAIVNVTGDSAEHRYTKEGEFQMKIILENDDGKISRKNFKILVGNPETSINVTIRAYEKRIAETEESINGLAKWIKDGIGNVLKIDETKNNLKKIKNDFANLGKNAKDEDYSAILERLFALNVPTSIGAAGKGVFPGEIGFGNIYTDYIREISNAEEIVDEEAARAEILAWVEENYDLEIEFETFAADTDSGAQEILTRYKVEIAPKDGDGKEAFLVLGRLPDGTSFKQDYGQKTLDSGGIYIPLGTEREAKTIEFLISGERIEPELMGIYISPSLNELNVNISIYEKIGFAWGKFLVWMGVLVIIVFIVYVILQEWYKRYYEKSLFKNPDDIYNIINFIYNSRVAGRKDEETKQNLIERKWIRERINYAFRKIDGKRTGMWEIPIFKIFENKKVRQELQKKHPNARIDARFIKRQVY